MLAVLILPEWCLCKQYHYIIRSYGWRYGLQIIAGLVVTAVVSASFYRSATLYHPQRRAILHLKAQRRKVLEIGPGGSGTEDVRKLKAYKNVSLHLAIASAFMASFGVSIPVVYLVSSPSCLLQIRYTNAHNTKNLKIFI